MADKEVSKGFLKRPKPLLVINIWLLISPLAYLGLLISYIITTSNPYYGPMFYEYIFVLIILPLFVGISLRWMNFLAWWLVVFYSAILILHNVASIFIFRGSPASIVLPIFIIFQLVCIGIIVYFVIIHKQFREIFFDRRLRWWESLSRFKIDTPVYLTLKDGSNRMLEIDDISLKGMCIYIKDTSVNPEEIDEIKFEFFDTHFISEVRYIWTHDSRAGLNFINTDKENRANIKKIIKMEKKVAKVGPLYFEEHKKKDYR